ncbi:MAG: SDR family oxidoreductase [Rhodobacteraceae bacterium]|nr:SDR family oxidoreductase [Paracoccaceae bacterium]
MLDHGKFHGKKVIVTGAGSGIGLETAHRFLNAGASVVGVDQDPTRFENLSADSRLLPVTADLSERGIGEQVVADTIAEFGRIDVLVNNAGVAPAREGFYRLTTTHGFGRSTSI